MIFDVPMKSERHRNAPELRFSHGPKLKPDKPESNFATRTQSFSLGPLRLCSGKIFVLFAAIKLAGNYVADAVISPSGLLSSFSFFPNTSVTYTPTSR